MLIKCIDKVIIKCTQKPRNLQWLFKKQLFYIILSL